MRDPAERLLDILEAIAAIERHLDGDKAAFEQDERPLQPSVVDVGLIRAKRFLGVIVNLDEVVSRPFRKAELSHAGRRPADAR